MNYYRFLDSRDIRNHLENMEYPLHAKGCLPGVAVPEGNPK